MKKNNLSIIWDWNGTIVNDAFVFIKIMNGFLKERGLPLIFKNQTRTPFLSSAIIKSSWIPMGNNCDSYKFRILNWRLDGDFKLEQGEIMIKISGLDLKQVAKQYVEDLEKENSLQKED